MLSIKKVVFKWNNGALKKIQKNNDKIIYDFARTTLDKSYKTIPLSANVNNGRLRQSSMAYGVKSEGDLKYSIASTTSYAERVWNFNDSTTNWTTSGTHSKWYLYTLKTQGKTMLNEVLGRNKLK